MKENIKNIKIQLKNIKNNINNIKNDLVTPVFRYNNINRDKYIISKNNINKSAVYRLVNNKNGKSYISSSINLSNKLNIYFSLKKLKEKEGSIIIYRSLLKYGHSNFSLEIMEYCEPSILIEREQYYFDILKPEYNICKKAGSSLGFKHSETTKSKMRIDNLGKRHTHETRNKLSFSLKHRIKINNKPRTIMPETRLKLTSRCKGVSVKVYDKSNNLVKAFPTITSAAKHFCISERTMYEIERRGVSYDDYVYKFEIKDTRVWVYDCNHELVNVFYDKLKASIWYNIPYTTMSRYIKSGKLYKNKYYFSFNK